MNIFLAFFAKVPWTELWVPDASFYNGVAKMQFSAPDQMNRVVLFPDGSVVWVPQVTVKTVCKAKGKDQEQVN